MTKKANGEGSIAQLPSGRWRVRVMVAGVRYSANTDTRKEAQQKYREFLGHTDRGLVPPTQKVTLQGHIERWQPRHQALARLYRYCRREANQLRLQNSLA